MDYSYQEKKQVGRGGWTCFLETPIPHLVTPAALKIPQTPDTTKLHPSRKLQKTVLHPLDILRPKTKTSGNCTSYVVPTSFFLITPGNSMLFLINPWKFHWLFLQYPYRNFTSSIFLAFFWNKPIIVIIFEKCGIFICCS